MRKHQSCWRSGEGRREGAVREGERGREGEKRDSCFPREIINGNGHHRMLGVEWLTAVPKGSGWSGTVLLVRNQR